jgi:hypothetical protein
MKKQQDDIRNILSKIRKLQKENTKIDVTGTDDVRSFLENKKREKILKNYPNKSLLTEEENYQDLTTEEQREEENKFKEVVSKLVKFEKLKVYRQNVEWSGELLREKIKWVFSLNENDGCYISIETEDMLQLTDQVIETLKKLKGYYSVWGDDWGSRLTGTPEKGGETGTAAPEAGGEFGL